MKPLGRSAAPPPPPPPKPDPITDAAELERLASFVEDYKRTLTWEPKDPKVEVANVIAAARAAEQARQAAAEAAAKKAADEARKTKHSRPGEKDKSRKKHSADKDKDKDAQKKEREALKEKKLLKLVGAVVVKCMSKHQNEIDHERFKRHAKDVRMISTS